MTDEDKVADIVSSFATYEDFLDSQITQQDLFYLEDEELGRQLVELGYRGNGELLKRAEFEAKKAELEAARLAKRSQQKTLCSQGRSFECAFLAALAEREESNRLGQMNTIIFVRDVNGRGQEISGYIDYAARLKSDDFELVFGGKKRLLPRSSDLSFYNWETQTEKLNQTANFQVYTTSYLFYSK